ISIALLPIDDEQIDFEIYCGDVVHCQGRAVSSREAAPGRLDLEQLEAEAVQVPLPIAETSADYVLHPALRDGALQTTEPASLQMLRIVSPCPPETVA